MEFDVGNKVFEEKVRDIYHDVRYAIEFDENGQEATSDQQKEIHRKILSGFKSGQKKILIELKALQTRAKENQVFFKTARREGNKNLSDELVLEVKTVEYQEYI